jgi:tetraacyldisaccharide 4'-kinase
MAWIERHWERVTPVSVLLYPASLLFRAAVAARRAAYRAGLLATTRLPVPVVVIGNVTVGGTGKTPLVIWLAAFLRERGRRPGILSRGYGGTAARPAAVPVDGDPGRYGDEPVLMAQRSGCPVWIGADRVAAGRALLAAHPDCDVIVSDDGLQHYRLARDVEIVVHAHGARNDWMLPAGPLREPPARVSEADALVVRDGPAGAASAEFAGPVFSLSLEGGTFHNLLNPAASAGADRFRHRSVRAVAGIAHPQRFFLHLQHLGIDFTAHPYPDHHAYRAEELAFPGAEAVLMTEKDAVKCQRFADERHWALRVDAKVDPALGDLVLNKLGPARPPIPDTRHRI